MVSTQSKALPAVRLLDAASALFVTEGIRAVGIERILSRAGVARASLYQVYGSKDGLIVAYLERHEQQDRLTYEREAALVPDAADRVLLAFDIAMKSAPRRKFRGCIYLNAATEFPEDRHPVNDIINRHRKWLVELWEHDLHAAGISEPGLLIAQLTLLYDGALAGSKLSKSVEPIMQARQLAAQLISLAAHKASAHS